TFSITDAKQVIAYEENKYYRHHYSHSTSNCYYSGCDDKNCKDCSNDYNYIDQILKKSRDNYNALNAKGLLLSVADRTKINRPLIVEALIKPFDDESLMNQLLLAHDTKGNTPFFYAYANG